jgi:large subunit ribosomal protein L4
MISLQVYNQNGDGVGQYDIDPAELAPRISKQLLHDVVVMYQTNLRQGSARTKSRSDVAGTTKKMYRQKGTGNARAGSRRSNIRRGGGHAFAKRPRDYSYRLPKKAIQAATRMAVAVRIQEGQIVVLDDLKFAEPKTQAMAKVLKAVGVAGESALVTTNGYDANVYKSARNIDRVNVMPVAELNALAVLGPGKLVVTKAALDAFRERAREAMSGKLKSDG